MDSCEKNDSISKTITITTATTTNNNNNNDENKIDNTKLVTIKRNANLNDIDSHTRGNHGSIYGRPITYTETFMHMLKGNIGPGAFAMGDAFRNAGLLVSPIATVILGLICVHCQHSLLNCSKSMKEKLHLKYNPDFANTVELCFEHGPVKFKRYSRSMKHIVNMFVCITQLGFTCVYFVFISSNSKQLCDYYGYYFNINLHMLIYLLPILLLSMIPNLKLLVPLSTMANCLMATSLVVVFYYAFQDIPSISERHLIGELHNFPLFYGTTIYVFEGIALILPLKNAMKHSDDFDKPFGILNIAMIFITTLFTAFGFFGYLKWGENVQGSLTLNLPEEEILAQVVKISVSIAVIFTYPLQFYLAIQILWVYVNDNWGPFNKHSFVLQSIFRACIVVVTFGIAELVPQLNLFISLIGALCSTALALIFPSIIQLITTWDESGKNHILLIIKNSLIFLLAIFGLTTGTYECMKNIISTFFY